MNSRIRKVLDQIGYNKAKAKNPLCFMAMNLMPVEG